MIMLASLGAGLVKSMKSASKSVRSIQDTFCGSASVIKKFTHLQQYMMSSQKPLYFCYEISSGSVSLIDISLVPDFKQFNLILYYLLKTFLNVHANKSISKTALIIPILNERQSYLRRLHIHTYVRSTNFSWMHDARIINYSFC